MSPGQRKLIASVVLMAFLAFWIWAAATIGTHLAEAPKWLTALYFIVAGVGWALPLRPLFLWMNRGGDRG